MYDPDSHSVYVVNLQLKIDEMDFIYQLKGDKQMNSYLVKLPNGYQFVVVTSQEYSIGDSYERGIIVQKDINVWIDNNPNLAQNLKSSL